MTKPTWIVPTLIEAASIAALLAVLRERQIWRWGYPDWDVFEAYYLGDFLTSAGASIVALGAALAVLALRPPETVAARVGLYLLAPAVLFLSQAALRWGG